MSGWVVRLHGWRKGPHDRVSLVKLIRERRRIGLREAKALMEQVVEMEGVVFDFEDENAARAFSEAARATGAVARMGQTS